MEHSSYPVHFRFYLVKHLWLAVHIRCEPTEKKMRKSIEMLSDVWGLSNFPSNWLGLKGKFLAGSEEEGVEPVCGYCSMRNVHLKCNKCISHNQEDLMHGCEELQCLLPLLLATKRTFTLMCCKQRQRRERENASTILNHSYCTLPLAFKTAPKTETVLTSLGEKRCTSAPLFEAKK